jgi:hypothetical protein
VWLCDGTFYTSPKEYTQIFTVHWKIRNSYFPIVHCFLKDKKESCYVCVFEYLKNFLSDSFPKNIIVDLEYALINAVEKVFPNTNIGLCLFHYGQSIWRNIQSKGLTCMYKENVDFRFKIKMILCLPFERTENFIETFKKLNY